MFTTEKIQCRNLPRENVPVAFVANGSFPDVRQKNRQKTCDNPECRKEHHRRQCAKWNKKNKEYFQSNYLNKKLEKVGRPPPETATSQPVTQKIAIPECRIRPILPHDIILSEFGIRNLVIMDYFAEQLLVRMRDNLICVT